MVAGQVQEYVKVVAVSNSHSSQCRCDAVSKCPLSLGPLRWGQAACLASHDKHELEKDELRRQTAGVEAQVGQLRPGRRAPQARRLADSTQESPHFPPRPTGPDFLCFRGPAEFA